MNTQRCIGKALFLAAVICLANGLHPVLADVQTGCYGNGQVSVYWTNHTLTGDAEYHNVTLTGTLNMNGYVLRVRGTLTNYGRITDLSSGGAGGSGGDGADGGHIGALYSTYYEPCCCTPGNPGQSASCLGGGHGGPGGGGGGGGGGTEHSWPTCWLEGGVSGGDGGGGGVGGDGGGCVKIYAYKLNNQGIIEVDGKDGDDGDDGTLGEFEAYVCNLVWRDAAGGGGGGGGGGDGGDGGVVEICYANLIEAGEIHADGGEGGRGGSKGGSQCGEQVYAAGGLQVWHYGSPGCDPGSGGCGYGGYGGESDIGLSCGPTAHGQDGFDGCDGEDGTVIFMQDWNCNAVPTKSTSPKERAMTVSPTAFPTSVSWTCSTRSLDSSHRSGPARRRAML